MIIFLFRLAFYLILLHVLWYVASRIITRRNPPSEREIKAFHQAEKDIFGLNAVKDILEQPTIRISGETVSLTVLAREPGRPTLVFIPGTSVYAQLYTGFLKAMYDEGFNVVSFDPRSHGRSGGPRGDYTFGGIVDDALAVCAYARERFGNNVAIAGSSQGGMAAFYAAARDNSLKAAVCHNLADLNGRDNLVLARFIMPASLTPLALKVLDVYKNFAFPSALYLDLTREFLPDGRDAAGFLKKDPLAVTWFTFRALRSLVMTPLPKPIEKITVPVMVVHSDKDHIFPQDYVEDLYRRLSCPKEFLLLKDREHLIMTNNVDEVAPSVAAWLKKTMEQA